MRKSEVVAMLLTQDKQIVQYLVGADIISSCPLEPYALIICEFLSELSKELRSSKEVSIFPDIMAFAYFCRKKHIEQLKKAFNDGKTRLGLGILFHIAPSNIPINFAFSFVFGLLAGNANIVRVPSKNFPQIAMICKTIKKILKAEQFKILRSMICFIRYEQDDKTTAFFSKNCNARIIWGGDKTVEHIRSFPIALRSSDITFPDRYSFCMINADAVMALDHEKLQKLVNDFYNDTYLMDQNACSSPHLIIWLGNEKQKAKERFWGALEKIVEKKYFVSTVIAIDKYTQFCHDAISHDKIARVIQHKNNIYRLVVNSLPNEIDQLRGRCGYFYEHDLVNRNDLWRVVNQKFQTLVYFGLNQFELRDEVLMHRLTGIDRIVPIGKALDMGVIWDGYDMVKVLSRIIDVI